MVGPSDALQCTVQLRRLGFVCILERASLDQPSRCIRYAVQTFNPENNYNEDGFLAKTLEQEIKTPDLELNQLISIEDVTAKVNASVKSGMSPQEASKARQAAMANIEKESLDKTGLRSDVVTLYGGGRYHLYRYKQYTDVRLVWAPEASAAFFGGDADNFEYLVTTST